MNAGVLCVQFVRCSAVVYSLVQCVQYGAVCIVCEVSAVWCSVRSLYTVSVFIVCPMVQCVYCVVPTVCTVCAVFSVCSV